MDPEKSEWFTIFKIIFECTSAYSTIGLSLGTPNNNWSFCGEFGTASKLVVSLFFPSFFLFHFTPLWNTNVFLPLSTPTIFVPLSRLPLGRPWTELMIDDWSDATRPTSRFTSSNRSVCLLLHHL
jgi:hypothetical protein